MRIFWCLITLVFLSAACRQRYNSPVHVPAAGYLVVEGFINAAGGQTEIRLSRSAALDSPVVVAETAASINIEGKNGMASNFALTETGAGIYDGTGPALDITDQYRLHIRLTNGKEYVSDFSPAKITPPIDSVSWQYAPAGVSIYASTHDPQNSTHYYKWDFVETWKYTAAYNSSEIYHDGTLVPRRDSEQIYTCYNTLASSDIIVASSTKFASDEIYDQSIQFIPFTTDKLIIQYSINVNQYALSQNAFEFFQKLQKNTEELGSIFDAQPSEITGNLHNLNDASETVVGYVECSTQTQKRIFIDRLQLPPTQITSGYEYCSYDTVINNSTTLETFFSSGGYYIPLYLVYANGQWVGETATGPDCADCRYRGGVLEKPDFWP